MSWQDSLNVYVWSHIVEPLTQVVLEETFDGVLDVRFRRALTGHEDRCGGCLSALDAFGMVVRHFRRSRRIDQNIVQRTEREADRWYRMADPLPQLL